LKKNNVAPDEILRHEYSERFSKLAAGVAGRAKNFYRLARQTLPPEDRRSMVAAELMGSVYWQLLQKLERQRFNVFNGQPTRLNKAHKIFLTFQSWLRFTVGAATPGYGTP
jgi:phytoene synthase